MQNVLVSFQRRLFPRYVASFPVCLCRLCLKPLTSLFSSLHTSFPWKKKFYLLFYGQAVFLSFLGEIDISRNQLLRGWKSRSNQWKIVFVFSFPLGPLNLLFALGCWKVHCLSSSGSLFFFSSFSFSLWRRCRRRISVEPSTKGLLVCLKIAKK